ncbi:sugar ABC transporter substrate-binding protein [Acetivibrio cellulolyticus]|uniref:sugar ABC transporter substrate-binding protein n=1 Tax=Acetivibrio cellulolyticus TaxID=35830 RepID=UPI0001E2F0A3|nr:ABC transporter substrate binding protein [Acetivibrio cellulolyticus]
MKKLVNRISLFLFTLVFLFACSGCVTSVQPTDANSGSDSDSTDTSKSEISIGLSLPTQKEERWVKDRITMEAEAKALGVDLKVQVSEDDAVKQDSQCDYLISQGIDILILAPSDAKSSASIVDKAHKAGIKVISYDRLVMGTDVDVYLSFDNVKVGELQGEYITKLVPKGNYVVLAGSPSDNNATLFKKGAMKYIQPLADKGDIKIVLEDAITDWQPSEAMKKMQTALSANGNKIDAVLAPNDGTAGGCIQALAEQKLDGKIPITGQDSELQAAQRIVQGTQTMTIFKDTRELGKEAIKIAKKILNGEDLGATQTVNNEKIDVPSILLTPVVVDKNNIDDVLINSGYLKKDDVYKK